MKLITWNTSYESGVLEIDQQHQKLVNIINDLHDAMMQGKGIQMMDQLLESLLAYTQDHFEYEEQWIKDNRNEKFEQHKVLHEKLTAKVYAFKEEFESQALNNTVRANNFLKHWLMDHVLEEDLRMINHS